VRRIVVHYDRIEIHINRVALRQTVLCVSDDLALPSNNRDDQVTIEAAALLKRCEGELRITGRYQRAIQMETLLYVV
jgi:hypothetical protein